MRTTNKKAFNIVFVLVCLFVSIHLLSPADIHAKNLSAGVILADDHGQVIYQENSDEPFIPASTLKVLTGLAALRFLGDQYHFPTAYYYDKNTRDLYIKGFGDPLFISEVIDQFCRCIASTYQIDTIHHIIIDQTYFSHQIQIPGKGNSLNPYDASVGALCANFNTIMFKQSPTGEYISAEPQTPFLPIFYEDAMKSGLNRGRIVLTEKQSRMYPGLLIQYFFNEQNIRMTGSVLEGTFLSVPGMEKHTFRSPFTIKEVIQKLLKYSNNFIANQILLTMGAKADGPPATIEKGLAVIKTFSDKHLKISDLNMLEGSGLSRSTRLTPKQMLTILQGFMPYYQLLKNEGNDYYKTGTLSDVRTRAGYLLGKNRRLYPYVIMINQKDKGYGQIHNKLLTIVQTNVRHETN